MKTKSILLLPALFVVLACNPKPAPNSDQVLTDSLITGLGNAISKGDIEKTMNYMADDVLVLDMGTTFASRDSLRAHMEPLMPFYKNFTFHKGLSTINDDLITYHGLFSVDWTMEEVPQPVRGVVTLVWQKQTDGQWKVILENLNFGMLAKK